MTERAFAGGRRIGSWQVAFSQDCNLRCDYCVTGYGALGGAGGVMSDDIQRRFIQRAFEWLGGGEQLALSFGCGETFLHFDAFAAFVERLQLEAGQRGVSLDIRVITNGTCFGESSLEWCLRNRIQLSFSIDGAALPHDRHRRDASGTGTHARALAAWRQYHELLEHYPGAPRGRIRSVIAEGERLSDAIAFWAAEGAALFDPTIEEPSQYAEDRRATWDVRRRLFLDDLEAHAVESARRLAIPHFMRDYRGPSIILDLWTRLFIGGNAYSCGAGCSTLAVDCGGDIYPCDGFTGRSEWRIGTLTSGIEQVRAARLAAAVADVRRPCASCDVRNLCDGGCLAANPLGALTLNFRGGCRFFAEVAAIAQRSYGILQGRAA